MIWREDQLGFQFAVERPQKELDTIRVQGVGIHRLVWLENTWESRAKEVEVVLLKAPPDTNILVQVLGKFHQDVRQKLATCASTSDAMRRV